MLYCDPEEHGLRIKGEMLLVVVETVVPQQCPDASVTRTITRLVQPQDMCLWCSRATAGQVPSRNHSCGESSQLRALIVTSGIRSLDQPALVHLRGLYIRAHPMARVARCRRALLAPWHAICCRDAFTALCSISTLIVITLPACTSPRRSQLLPLRRVGTWAFLSHSSLGALKRRNVETGS